MTIEEGTGMYHAGFLLGLKPGADVQEYKRRHDEIWPEMAAALRAAGIIKYGIYLHTDKRTLFGYIESDVEIATVWSRMAGHPVNDRWQVYMADMIDIPTDPVTGQPVRLAEMFYLTETADSETQA